MFNMQAAAHTIHFQHLTQVQCGDVIHVCGIFIYEFMKIIYKLKKIRQQVYQYIRRLVMLSFNTLLLKMLMTHNETFAKYEYYISLKRE